jgi:hypothetical protein
MKKNAVKPFGLEPICSIIKLSRLTIIKENPECKQS